MDWLQDLLIEIVPLYVISVLGYIAGRFFPVDTKSITTLSIYIISPVVFLLSIAQMTFTAGAIWAPLMILALACVVGVATVRIMRLYAGEKAPYLAGMAAGTSNWGYFGIPVAIALFPPDMLAAYIMIGFGLQIYENTLGIYFISRGSRSPLESVINIFRFPSVYAIILGLILSYISFEMPDYGEKFFELFKGAYTVLGMMIIGLGLAGLRRFTVDVPFVASMFALRFALWPVLALALAAADRQLGLLGETFHAPLLLFSIMPMAANNIAFAAQFDMNPGKASVAVLLTTLFALFYIPLIIRVLGI